MRTSLLSIALAVLAVSAAQAVEVTVANDSTTGGTPSTVANVFLAGETVASTLTATCSGDIVAAQVYWASQFGGAPSQFEQSITLFGPGSFPTPGPILLNQGGANAVVSLPQLFDGVMNEFRFLDPPTDSVPLRVPVSAGQSFVVGLTLLNQSSGNAFAPSVTYDQDGCQAQRNAVDVMPGGWSDACPLGVTGDWVIRAVVDCAPSAAVPLIGDAGLALLLGCLGIVGAYAVTVGRGRGSRSRASAR